MRVRRRTIGVAVVVTMAALALGAGAVWAQSTGDNAGASFLDRVAAKLGIDSADLEQAIQDTRNEDIDAAVTRGDLTQEQADRLKERPAEGGPGFGFPMPGHRPFGPEFRTTPDEDGNRSPTPHGFGFGFGMGDEDPVAELAAFLGTTKDQLLEELRAEGATPASVAEAHGKSRDELKAFISEKLTSKLADAVTNGMLTQEQSDRITEKTSGFLDNLLDSEFFGKALRFEFRHGAGGRNDDGSDVPSSPTPQSGVNAAPSRS